MLTKCIWTSQKISFFKKYFEKIKKYTLIKIIFQHLAFLFYSTHIWCFKTVFTFYVAASKKKYASSKVFFPLMAGLNSDRPGKILNKNISQFWLRLGLWYLKAFFF